MEKSMPLKPKIKPTTNIKGIGCGQPITWHLMRPPSNVNDILMKVFSHDKKIMENLQRFIKKDKEISDKRFKEAQ